MYVINFIAVGMTTDNGFGLDELASNWSSLCIVQPCVGQVKATDQPCLNSLSCYDRVHDQLPDKRIVPEFIIKISIE